MSHEVESMFSVGARPWHGLGHVLKGQPSMSEAIVLAGLNWQVDLRPVAATVTDEASVAVEIPSHRAVMRMDTGAVLGVVGEDFRPLQNSEAFGFFEPLVAEGLLSLETAGSLRHGRRVWVMARIPGDPAVIVPAADDVVDPFVLLCHGHDGSLALRVGFNPVRVVCANTLAAAMGHQDGMTSVRHTAGMVPALDKVRDTIAAQIRCFQDSAEAWRLLAARTCTDAAFTTYALRVAAVARGLSDDELREAMPSGRTGARLLGAVRPLFEGGAGNDRAGVRGTWWAAYNAVTQWLTHERGSGAGSDAEQAARRFEALHLGESRRLSMRALMLAIEGADESNGAALPPPPLHADGEAPEEIAPLGDDAEQAA